jgi:hypothetical protein
MKRRHLKILIINQYYPPDTAATAKVAKTLTKALSKNFSVTVLSGRPSYNPDEYHPRYLLRRVIEKNVVIERVGSTGLSRHRMQSRIINYLSFLCLSFFRALMIKADAVVSMTDPPLACIVAALVAKLRKCAFVYSIQDLHPDMALASGMIQHGLLAMFWEKLHRQVLKQANLVIVLGEDMRQRVLSKGIYPGKIKVIRHGAPTIRSLPSPSHSIAREIQCDFPFAVIHAGNLGFYGAWETLISAAKLVEREGIGFVFVGDGAAKTFIQEMALGCNNVRFLPFRPVEEVPHVLSAGDMHIVTVRRGLEGMVVPSKLYPILAAGRPVLAVVSKESDVAKIVTRNKCGIVAAGATTQPFCPVDRKDNFTIEKSSIYASLTRPWETNHFTYDNSDEN